MPYRFTKRRLSATVYYIFAALLIGVVGSTVVQWLIPTWQQGLWSSSWTVATVHTMILGFMLTTVFGVMFQVIPIAFQAPPIPRHVLYWHLPLHIVAVSGMIAGFLLHTYFVTGIFGTVLLISTLMFLWMAAKSYRKARNKTAVHQHLIFPFVSLAIVMLFGIWMAFALPGTGFHLYLTHIFFGVFGFWVTLVLVVSYKFIPMFTLSHGYKSSLPVAIRVFVIGIALYATASLLNLSYHIAQSAGLVIALLGLIHFARDMVAIVRARKRKRILYSIRMALTATTLLFVGSIGLFAAAGFSWFPLVLPSAYLLVMGGFTLLILAYVQKIVPFLWYEYRFSHHKDRKQAPLIDEMMPSVMTRTGITLYMVSVLAGWIELILYGVFRYTVVLTALQTLLCVVSASGWLLILFSALKVLTIGGPRIDEPEEGAD